MESDRKRGVVLNGAASVGRGHQNCGRRVLSDGSGGGEKQCSCVLGDYGFRQARKVKNGEDNSSVVFSCWVERLKQ